MTKIRLLLALAAIAAAAPAAAEPLFQHVVLAPSRVQGELFTGAMKTNKGVGQVTLLPIFFRNAAASDPWYQPSFAPLVVGGGAGGGNTNVAAGSVLDVGPQLIMGLEQVVGLFSAPGKARIADFFNCSASATACAALSAGVLANLNLEEDGKFSDTWKALGRHPVGYFVGPSLLFGGAPVAAVRR